MLITRPSFVFEGNQRHSLVVAEEDRCLVLPARFQHACKPVDGQLAAVCLDKVLEQKSPCDGASVTVMQRVSVPIREALHKTHRDALEEGVV